MPRDIRTVVAAAALGDLRRRLIRNLAVAELELLAMPEDGRSALECLHALRPDLLVADQFLPELDGVSLALRAASLHLPVRPAILLLADEKMPPSNTALSEACASVLNRTANAAAFVREINALQSAPLRFSERETRLADRLLDELGFPKHPGRDCMKLAALICATDERCRRSLGAMLYPRIAREIGMTAVQAERAMRRAIDLAWQSDKFENQYRIFADTVDARRGRPTLSEMISRLTDILRLEG